MSSRSPKHGDAVLEHVSGCCISKQQNRLRPWCQIESGIVGQSKSVERMGAAEPPDPSRHADTQDSWKLLHSRRWLDLQDFGWAELIDKLDKVRLLADLSQYYASQGNAALNRAWTTSSFPLPAATRAPTPACPRCPPARRSPSAPPT